MASASDHQPTFEEDPVDAVDLSWNDLHTLYKAGDRTTFHRNVETHFGKNLNVNIIRRAYRAVERMHADLVNNKNKKKTLEKMQDMALSSSTDDFFVIKIDQSTPVLFSKRKHLDELKPQMVEKRLAPLFAEIKDFAEEEETTPTNVAAILMKTVSYHEDRKLSQGFSKMVTNSDNDKENYILLDVALTIYTQCELGIGRYTKLRKLLKSAGHDILPPMYRLSSLIKDITPEVVIKEDEVTGMKSYSFPLLPALKSTMTQFLEHRLTNVNLSPDDKGIINIQARFSAGWDGSGSHKMYHQQGAKETHNLILSVFNLLSVDSDRGRIYEEKFPNSASLQRPLQLKQGGEQLQNIQSYGPLTKEMAEAEKTGLTFTHNTQSYHVKVEA